MKEQLHSVVRLDASGSAFAATRIPGSISARARRVVFEVEGFLGLGLLGFGLFRVFLV